MSFRKRRGDAGERWVKNLLKNACPEATIVDLSPSWPCDLLQLDPVDDDRALTATWIEVKVLRRGRPKLTVPEAAFFADRQRRGDFTRLYHLRPDGVGFQLVSIR